MEPSVNGPGNGKHPGPPTKKTPEVLKRICDALRNGLSLGMASRAAGLGRHTAREWAKADPALSAIFDAARAECGERYSQMIADAAATDWRAAAWVLERRVKGWAKPTEITGKDGGPIQVGPSDGAIARAILAERRRAAANQS